MQYELRVDTKSIHIDCPNEITLGRAKWLLQKEPGTIAWIDGFEPGSVLWDIGANVGVYSLYAGIVRECRVLAFEPAAANYFGLNNNIILNRLDEKVHAYCLALDRSSRLNVMRMRDNIIGTALHTFGEAVDYKGDPFIPAWNQGAFSISIDLLVEQYAATFPNHIKIDVDGLEVAVVEGGAKTFADPRFTSVLIEIDLNDVREVGAISAALEAAGLVRDDAIPGNVVRSVEGAQIYNLVYRRP
jgi:FkbM family methyltransferase